MTVQEYLTTPIGIEDYLDRFLPRNPVIFDVGSCEGFDSIRYSRIFPDGRIYSFEPIPKNVRLQFEYLKKYDVKNVEVFQLALSSNNGTAEFFVSSGTPEGREGEDWDYGNKSSSLLPPGEVEKVHSWLKFGERIKVNTQTIQNFVVENGIKQIDFMHLDVQGAELEVLKGAGKFIKEIKMLWMEVENVELYAGQPLRDKVEKFMKKKGFKLIHEKIEGIAGDQLYLR